MNYRLCSDNVSVDGEIVANDRFVPAPLDDARCSSFGDNLSSDYLACEAVLPIKS